MALVNVDVDLLRALVAVSQFKSFTHAAEHLFRTQSAISLQIRRLEEFVGQPVLDRGRNISLTPAGEMVYSYAVEILKLNDSLFFEIQKKNKTDVIRIGTPDDYAQLILPRLMKSFVDQNRHVEIHIISDLSINLAAMVSAGALDLALVSKTEAITGITVSQEPLCWVCSPGMEALNSHPLPLAVSPVGCIVREAAINALNADGRRWRIAYASNQFSPLRSVIVSGQAVGVLPSRAVPKEFIRIGQEYGLPDLPFVEIALVTNAQSPKIARQLAASIMTGLNPTFSVLA